MKVFSHSSVARLRMVLAAFTMMCLTILCLGGCQPTPEAQLLDYHRRVANVLDQDSWAFEAAPLPAAPSRRSLQLAQTPLKLDLLDFLRLRRCELSRILGEQNSAMGKVAPPSQRLHRYRDILLHGPACVDHLQPERPELAQQLADALAIKRSERQRAWWNAWLTSEEWQAFTRISTAALPVAGEQPASVTAGLQALDYALVQGQRWQTGDLAYDTATMEFQQQQLLLSELIGRWRLSQALLTRVSRATAEVIETRLATQPMCVKGMITPPARYMNNVFRNFYAGSFQPYFSHVHRLGRELLGKLAQLQELAPAPAAYTRWLQQLESEASALDAAHIRHVKAWQDILGQCDMMPGRSSSS